MRGLVIVSALLITAAAAAQPANSDLGLKLGEKSRLHFGVDLGTGFDTNPNYVPMTQGFYGDMMLALRPQLKLDIPGQMLDVEGAARLNFLNYFGLMNPATGNLRQLDGDAGLQVEVNRGGFLGFALSERLTRAVDPGVASLGARLARTRNDAGLGVELRPGGGLLAFALSYNFGIELFDPNSGFNLLDVIGLGASASAVSRPEAFNNMEHRLKLHTEYRFLPKTGAFLDIYGGTFRYLDASSPNVASNPVGIELGVMGALTGKISGVAKVGYTNPLIIVPDANGGPKVSSATFIGAVGQLELRYQLTELNIFAAGVRREMRPIYMYSFFTDNRVYASTSHQLFNRVMLRADAAYAYLAFDQQIADARTGIGGGGNRGDHVVEGNLSAAWYILDWFAVGISDMLQWRTTNAYVADPNGSYYLSFFKNLTLLSVTAYY